jgi:hypothetical protein
MTYEGISGDSVDENYNKFVNSLDCFCVSLSMISFVPVISTCIYVMCHVSMTTVTIIRFQFLLQHAAYTFRNLWLLRDTFHNEPRQMCQVEEVGAPLTSGWQKESLPNNLLRCQCFSLLRTRDWSYLLCELIFAIFLEYGSSGEIEI